jgi:hypothetical protein
MVLRHAEGDLVKTLMNIIIVDDQSVTKSQIHRVWHLLLEREVQEFEASTSDESLEMKNYRAKRLKMISDILNYQKEDLGEILQTKTIILDEVDFATEIIPAIAGSNHSTAIMQQ